MLKRLFLSFALAVIAVPAFAAGTIPGISMTQQLDSLGHPLNAGKLYLIQAGTTSTPQNCYQDSGLTIPHPNPITLDSAGRIPQLFCDDGSIKIRLTNAAGVTQLVADNLLVVGPSGGGGGGGTVDPTTVLTTGDFKAQYNTGTISGFVRCNGRTIGNASSGATERANADTNALFVHFWTVDANLAVSGGRGASAAADYAANKTITLPDCRGRTIAGMSDMGNSDSGRLSTTYFGCTGLVLGCAGGAESKTLLTANLPPYTPSGTNSSVGVTVSSTNIALTTTSLGSGPFPIITPIAGSGGVSSSGTVPAQTFTGTAQGGTSTPFATASPAILMTIYIKL